MVYTADGVLDRLPTVVQAVIQLKPDVIMVPATLEAVAARKAPQQFRLFVGRSPTRSISD